MLNSFEGERKKRLKKVCIYAKRAYLCPVTYFKNMENSIYINTATTPNTRLALENSVRECNNEPEGKMRDRKILNAMKAKRNAVKILRIKAQYRATIIKMESAYNQAYA